MGPLTYINHLLLGLLIGYACGGRLLRLGQLPLRYAPVAIVLLALRVWLVSRSGRALLPEALIGALLVALLVAASALLWANRRIGGIPLMSMGISSNMLVMSFNGGFMPVQVSALATVGASPTLIRVQSAGRLGHSIPITETTALPWLADRILFPAFFLSRGIFSIGDLLIGCGLTYLIVCAMLDAPHGLWHRRSQRRTGRQTSLQTEHASWWGSE